MSDLENFFAAMDAKKKRKKDKGAKGKRKTKSGKKKKAKGGKKRKLSAYNLFVKAHYRAVASKVGKKNAFKKLGQMWRAKH